MDKFEALRANSRDVSIGLPAAATKLADVQHWDFTESLARLQDKFARSRRPISVNFRKLVQLHSGVDRATHLMHAYPAKLLLNIPLFFLNSDQFRRPGGTVYDPFSGTGTVLVEALLAGRRASGADANPLARLVAKVKTTPINTGKAETLLATIVERATHVEPTTFSPVVDVGIWFAPSVSKQLGRLLTAIRESTHGDLRDFFEVCFSSCVKRLSNADPRLSVPVRLPKATAKADEVVGYFRKAVQLNIRRLRSIERIERLGRPTIDTDARRPSGKTSSVDLVITSPPYGGAQKYIRASSLSIGWLGLAPDNELRTLERQVIGREHFSKVEYETLGTEHVRGSYAIIKRIWNINPLRAHIAATYLGEMQQAFAKTVDLLAPGGSLVLVVGNNNVCGMPFTNTKLLKVILEDLGLKTELVLTDEIRSRGLMTKRNKTAGLITREYIYVFGKRFQ